MLPGLGAAGRNRPYRGSGRQEPNAAGAGCKKESSAPGSDGPRPPSHTHADTLLHTWTAVHETAGLL